jgi:hypothetical protein
MMVVVQDSCTQSAVGQVAGEGGSCADIAGTGGAGKWAAARAAGGTVFMTESVVIPKQRIR